MTQKYFTPAAKMKKKTSNSQQEIKKVVRKDLTSEEVTDLNFYKDDLEFYDTEMQIANGMYNEIHGLWTNLTGGDYVPHNIRDVAELARSMVTARTYMSDVANKRIQLKKLIGDTNYRNSGGLDEGSAETINLTARAIVAELSQNPISRPKLSKKKEKENEKTEKEILDSLVEEKIENGEITMSRNDELVGVNDRAVVRYDKNTKMFVAVDSADGSIIQDFPKDRLPSVDSITRVTKDSAILSDTGGEVPLFDELEFDDDYIDEGP